MTRAITMLSATLVLGLTGAAYAADDATLNRCWGQVTKQFAPLGDHASAHSPVTPDPGEGGRRGVGNVSKEDHGALSEGGQGKHAIAVAPASLQESLPEECQGTEMP